MRLTGFNHLLVSTGVLVGLMACAAESSQGTPHTTPAFPAPPPITVAGAPIITPVVSLTSTPGTTATTPGAEEAPPFTGPAAVDAQAVWQQVRAGIPGNIPVYRPTWLPERFLNNPPVLGYVSAGDTDGPRYTVGYSSHEGEHLLFALGAVNSAKPQTTEEITVRGLRATWSTADGWPTQEVRWLEGPRGAKYLYSVQVGSTQLTRDELLRIIEELVPVAAIGAAPMP